MAKQLAYNPETPNAHLAEELAQFDYQNLTDENFEKYQAFVSKISNPDEPHAQHANTLYDFIRVKCVPVMRDRYPGLPNTPRDFKGIELVKGYDKPLMVTRIDFRIANVMNAQIVNEAATVDGNATYYLLQRPGDSAEAFAK